MNTTIKLLKALAILLAILVIIIVAQNYLIRKVITPEQSDKPVACTMDAMQCPDGTIVGRTPPKCEFVCLK